MSEPQQILCVQDLREPAVGALQISIPQGVDIQILREKKGLEINIKGNYFFQGPYCKDHLVEFLADATRDSFPGSNVTTISVELFQIIMERESFAPTPEIK